MSPASSIGVAELLALALALIMFGMGLSLTAADFSRILRHPRATAVALLLQVLLLPALCWGLVKLFRLDPLHAVGLLILAASPGGITANLYSHLFGGNVALNITLTALNTVLAIATLPLISNAAIAAFLQSGQVVPMQFGKVAEVVGIILVPVLLGMAARRASPGLAARAERPMKIFSALVLAVIVVGALVREWGAIAPAIGSLGPAVLAFNLLSLAFGFGLPLVARLPYRDAVAIGYEVGIHNSTLAVYVAISVLGSTALAVPAALYSISMYATGTLTGLALRRLVRGASAAPIRH